MWLFSLQHHSSAIWIQEEERSTVYPPSASDEIMRTYRWKSWCRIHVQKCWLKTFIIHSHTQPSCLTFY